MMRSARNRIILCLLSLAILLPGLGVEAQTPYQKPPKAIQDVLDALSLPNAVISPTRDRLLLVEIPRYPSIAQLSEPMLRIAGLRINPSTNGRHQFMTASALTIKNISDGKEIKVKAPANARMSQPEWSPDGKNFAFSNTVANGIELWIGDPATGQVRRIPKILLNEAYGDAIRWMPDGRTLLCQTIPAGRGAAPEKSRVPIGPTIQESYGKAAPIRTYQDMMQNPHDEALFEYYAKSQLELIDVRTGKASQIGRPAMIAAAQVAPDGNHLLVVSNHKPYSYLLPSFAFPKEVEVWDRSGKVVHKLASLPLSDSVPIDGVEKGPRSYGWRPTEPATLVWVEALDDGNPKKNVPHRDRVLMLKAPFRNDPVEIAKTEHRFGGLSWGERDGTALLTEFDRNKLRSRSHLINVDHPQSGSKVIWDRSIRDRYNDPGQPATRVLANGQRVILQKGNDIYLIGQGASPKGDRPFLSRFDLTTLKSERIFQCDDRSYESATALLTDDGSSFITRAESPSEPPNYFVRSISQGNLSKRALTNFPDPAPQLRAIKKQLVTYKRDDGVQLSFTLYLPPGYQPGTPLPTVVWAYPLEFTDADTASQVTGSSNRFTTINGYSHLFFALLGYAVLDNATMPVVGDPVTVNNTYVEQITASAKAAIDKAVELGVTDRRRVGVGGHSYGAFMTANLLAHTDLFKAGIARSGAYNRTLTPFGFQSERRTLWEASEMYLKVSPFMFADRIKEPILLIHGEADNNTGTFPIQSERMYQALKGNGGNVRYVTLPYESHGYSSRESTEHVLWEMTSWFEKHVKEQQPTASR